MAFLVPAFLFVTLVSSCLESSVAATKTHGKTHGKAHGSRSLREDPEVHMNTTQLITSKGYPCEDYDVHTSDGYILGIQRIPGGKNWQGKYSANKSVVLLYHGLLSCSACWVENLVNNSLGFMLADAGFDVWLGNSRGNTYGRRHEHLKPDQEAFWAFSWDEMAEYDLPATVDKILSITGAKHISYVGHSQGCEIAFAQLSRDTDLASKIKLFVALAPATYLGDVRSPIRLLVPFADELAPLITRLGHGEFLPDDGILEFLGKEICPRGDIPQFLCENVLFLLGGYDFIQMNASRIPVYVAQHPAGTSVQNVLHYAQQKRTFCSKYDLICPCKLKNQTPMTHFTKSVKSNLFQMYDFGPEENMKKYNQSTPPQYYPSNITNPIALYSGTADWLVTPAEMAKLFPEVKHLEYNGWEHLDFIWAMGAADLYNDVINLLKIYE